MSRSHQLIPYSTLFWRVRTLRAEINRTTVRKADRMRILQLVCSKCIRGYTIVVIGDIWWCICKFCVKCSSLVMKSYNDYQSNRKCCQGCFSQWLIDNSLIRKFEPPKANLFIFLLSDKSPLSSFYNLFKPIRNYDSTTLKSHQMFNRWTMEILVKVSVSRIPLSSIRDQFADTFWKHYK